MISAPKTQRAVILQLLRKIALQVRVTMTKNIMKGVVALYQL